jgi:hypothetical protein
MWSKRLVPCGVVIALATGGCVGADDSVTSDGGADVTVDQSVSEAGNDAAVDAGLDADASDGAIEAGPCDLTMPFQTPTAVPGVNLPSSNVVAATLSPDELTIWFSSDRYGGSSPFQVYTATRSTNTSAFSAPILATGLAPLTGNVFGLSVTPDLLTMILGGGGTGSLGYIDLFIATRPNVGSSFGAPTDMPNVNTSTDDETTPCIVPSAGALYFTQGNGPSAYTILRSVSLDGGVIFGAGSPVNAVDVNESNTQSTSPVVSSDELTIFFAGFERSGEPSGSVYIWEAQRNSTASPFAASTQVTELNTVGINTPSWLSTDQCRIYFETNGRGDGGTERNLFVATRP